MRKHYNIPVFITHSGCRNNCVFCNQKIITGQSGSADEEKIKRTIEKFTDIIYRNNQDNRAGAEIAFFGGSFTGLEKSEMIRYLEIANRYIDKYKIITGVRLSTRPDYITKEIIDILLKYNTKAIELGIQSMFDEVLSACKRGHTSKDSKNACGIIKDAGINLTGQIMLGLPGSNREKDIETAEILVKLGIDSARIYPAAVLEDTELCELYRNGRYEPLSLDEAVFRAKEIKKIFDYNNIKVIRMGLCSSDIDINDSNIIAGVYHPAFGELVESEIIYDRLAEETEKICRGAHCASGGVIIRMNDDSLVIYADKKDMSKTVGHKRRNIERLKEKFNLREIIVTEK
ncbi:MAG: radical SAM protein [Oscillospiraceae bacterium]|nr:radical SAM protein [Oscillospiraceae bacterium]